MNDDLQGYERWLKRQAARDAEFTHKPRTIKVVRHYRPVGFIVVISFLVFVQMLQWNVSPVVAVLATMLIGLLMVVFS